MAWVEVPKDDIYDKLEDGSNLAIAIFPDNPDYSKSVEMTDKTEAGKIFKLLQNEDTVKFFEEVEV